MTKYKCFAYDGQYHYGWITTTAPQTGKLLMPWNDPGLIGTYNKSKNKKELTSVINKRLVLTN